MSWKLKVREYGKIKSAEIEAAPLTLFVGDNNSGKSYLMSLLWGIQNYGITELVDKQRSLETPAEYRVMNWINQQLENTEKQENYDVCLDEMVEDLQTVLQEGINRNKNRLLKKVFNSSDVNIKELQIEIKDTENTVLRLISETGREKGGENKNRNIVLRWGMFEDNGKKICEIKYLDEARDEFLQRTILLAVLSMISGIPISFESFNRSVYLPAARTGFMLTKDVINKIGRNTVFNLDIEEEEISPFTRPINQFLDVMNDLVMDKKGKEEFAEIVEYLENGMAEGRVEMSTLPNHEVMYIPSGRKKGIPLRVVSAVVTELSPLILLLKHKKSLNMLFYEEPEMCLHPQLQHKMAKVICRLVNAGVWMNVTTHSDIILQYINNMLSLSEKENIEEIFRQLGYTPFDLLNTEQVKVYQFSVNSRGKTEVEELICGKNGFAVPTFNDALDKIMDEAYIIQE